MKRYIIGIDPSGSFHEGKGTTGFCILDAKTNKILTVAAIRAKSFKTAEDYWQAHLNYIGAFEKTHKDQVVLSVEDYLLYANKAVSQTNSTMETSQLIGILKMYASSHNIPYMTRPAVRVKKRWSNEILEHKALIRRYGKGWMTMDGVPLVSHTLDAIRHAVHCRYFELEEE